jgi:hypothetical protein
MACAGQDWAQAGTTSPSPTGRPSWLAWFSPAWMRCTQKVHFSITPRDRTVTSGLSCSWSGRSSWTSRQLKVRTLYGQLLEQYRVPTQRL